MFHREYPVYHCLVGLLVSLIVVTNAGPITTESIVNSVAEDSYSSDVPYEFPDDYSISLEQAVVSRKEFASAALLKTITSLVGEIERGNQERKEMMELVKDLQVRLKRQEEAITIAIETSTPWSTVINRRSNIIIQKRPRSCQELKQVGHQLSGFYIVQGSQRMEVVYCTFVDERDDGTLHYYYNY